MDIEQKPDGISIPFGHELARVNEGEPLILIRAGATVAQRLRAAGHIASAIADQLEAADRDSVYALIFKRDSEPVSVHVGTETTMREMYDKLSPQWSEVYLARVVEGPRDERQRIQREKR